MKIAFADKGGSGKTTLSSLFVRHLAGRAPVVAVEPTSTSTGRGARRGRAARGAQLR